MARKPSKGAAPKERADVLLRTRHLTMARYAHAYVRGNIAKFMSGLLLATGLIDERKVEGLDRRSMTAQSGSARCAMASKRWIAASAFWALPMKPGGRRSF
jgi:hypothetical protein